MKIYYEFDPVDDRDRLRVFSMAEKMLVVLQDFDSDLRSRAKYQDDAGAEKFRALLISYLNEHDVDLYD